MACSNTVRVDIMMFVTDGVVGDKVTNLQKDS